MKEATADEIRNETDTYLKCTRVTHVHMSEDPTSDYDYVIDSAKELDDIINEAMEIVLKC